MLQHAFQTSLAGNPLQAAMQGGLDVFAMDSPAHKELKDLERDLDLMEQVRRFATFHLSMTELKTALVSDDQMTLGLSGLPPFYAIVSYYEPSQCASARAYLSPTTASKQCIAQAVRLPRTRVYRGQYPRSPIGTSTLARCDELDGNMTLSRGYML